MLYCSNWLGLLHNNNNFSYNNGKIFLMIQNTISSRYPALTFNAWLCAELFLQEVCQSLQKQPWQCCCAADAAVWGDQHGAAVGSQGHDTLVVVLAEEAVCADKDEQLQPKHSWEG